jgi:hypothetical protein
MTTGPAATHSYGTLTPTAQRTPSRGQRQPDHHLHPSSPYSTPIQNRIPSGGMIRNRPGYEAAGDGDDETLKGEGEFSDELDDRTDWMRSGRQGKATIASCVSK